MGRPGNCTLPKYISDLRARGIEPVPTLWHWTFPLWFRDKGGFEKRENVRYFERFAAKVAGEFGVLLRYAIPLNEPNNYAFIGYLTGEWPPQRCNLWLAVKVYRNLVFAHRTAYRALKAVNPDAQVGIAQHFANMRPHNPHNSLNSLMAGVLSYLWNWWFTDRIIHELDFVGVNYYQTEYSTWYGAAKNPKQPVNDLGWYMEPIGIGRVLRGVWERYRKPVIITENGVADAHDPYRQWWLGQTIEAMQQALRAGVDLRGYLHWSLLDNFE